MSRNALIIAALVAALPAAGRAAPGFSIDAFRQSCGEIARPYASCVDQAKIYEQGLAAARAQHKLAAVLFGFNDCPPCNALKAWMETAEGKKAMAPYVLIEISIFDPSRGLRSEVYDQIVTPLHLSIARQSPYGVPHLVIVDPKTRKPLDHGMVGFNFSDPGATVEYLQSHAGAS
jgi:Thioredoxin-like